MATPSFTTAIGSAASRTYLTSPGLSLGSYATPAAHVLAQLRQRDHLDPSPYVLYGYAAMQLVLDAIRHAGKHGDNRAAVVDAAFAIHRQLSVLGRYSVLPDGETTIARYGVDRVRAGMPVFWRELNVSGKALYDQHVP